MARPRKSRGKEGRRDPGTAGSGALAGGVGGRRRGVPDGRYRSARETRAGPRARGSGSAEGAGRIRGAVAQSDPTASGAHGERAEPRSRVRGPRCDARGRSAARLSGLAVAFCARAGPTEPAAPATWAGHSAGQHLAFRNVAAQRTRL